MNTTRRIPFAFFKEGWEYGRSDVQSLVNNAQKVQPLEYDKSMKGWLFCPHCHTNLSRVPEDKDYFSNGREAYFSHMKVYRDVVSCVLRANKPDGKKYDTYEDVKKAIENEELVIIKEFMDVKPEINQDNNSLEYNETIVENYNGPKANQPAGRHTGEEYLLPSQQTSIASIVKNFDKNLYKYYRFPEKKHEYRLVDCKRSISSSLALFKSEHSKARAVRNLLGCLPLAIAQINI
jgi:hypothetical protein